MTTFYLIRHAEPTKGGTDPGLSERGNLQAQASAEFLKDKTIAHVYTSPLQRAKATALRIASILGAPLTVDNRLRERMNWGDIPGQSFEAFVELWNYCNTHRTFTPPTGLSAQQAGENLANFLDEISQRDLDAAIGVITHGGILGDFLVNTFSEDYLAGVHADWPHQKSNIFAHCSITIVEYRHNQCSVRLLAGTTHLSQLKTA